MIPQGYQRGPATHERKDADVISLLLIALLLFLCLGLCLLIAWGAVRIFGRERQAEAPPEVRLTEQVASFPPPQLIVNPGQEEKSTQLKEETELKTYGWVDRRAGVARLPIARAMELLLQRGLPEVGAGQTRLQLMQQRPQTDVQPENPITTPPAEVTP